MDNEPDPHWNIKFDFVLVSATSTIHFDVYDKKGMLQEIFSLKTITGAHSAVKTGNYGLFLGKLGREGAISHSLAIERIGNALDCSAAACN